MLQPMAPATALTPRIKAWLGTMPLPDDQKNDITLALANLMYISTDIILEEHADALLARPEISPLKPGTKIVLRKKLAELQVLHASCNKTILRDKTLQCTYFCFTSHA
jgi:hypothetical protein